MESLITKARYLILKDITEIPDLLKPAYLPGLDGLRAVSIMLVLAGHFLIGTKWVDYLPGGIGVDIFFVISGFLITTILLKEKVKHGNISFRLFYFRRALRVFPLVYLYLLVLLILNHVFDLHTTPRMFIVAGLYIGNFPVQYGSNWQTAHFWSLAVEEQFYLIFPFLLSKSVNRYVMLSIIIIFTLPIIVAAGRIPIDNHVLHKFVLAFTYLLGYGTSSILIGALGSILIFKGLIKTDFKVPYYLNLFILLAAILLHISGVLAWNTIIYVFPALIVIVIILNLKNSCALSKLLNTKLFIQIGVMSYSVYIWQQLFSYDQPWKNAFAGSNSLILNFIVLIVVSAISYYLYEKRFLLLKKHLKRS